MAAREPRSLESTMQVLVKLLLTALLVVSLIGLAVGVALSPEIVAFAYGARDWSHAGDIGQTYDAASAILAVIALGVVSASLWIQRSQFKHAQRATLREKASSLALMAIENPALGQCWGARFAPDHVDEQLFLYTAQIVLHWSHAWEDRELTEEQARDFMRQFFASEVPRMFWERHGEWHHPQRTLTRADQFIAMINREYLCAVKAGPPKRAYQPMASEESRERGIV